MESYGIEFREVGGDPAELMRCVAMVLPYEGCSHGTRRRLCIENGTFTVNFMREGMSKVSVRICARLSMADEARSVSRLA